MRILITGMLSVTVWDIALRLERDKHHVTLLGQGLEKKPPRVHAVWHELAVNHPRMEQVLIAGRFDAIIFMYGAMGGDANLPEQKQGAMLDALFKFLRMVAKRDIGRFVLMTDQRVFGLGQPMREGDTPAPDSPVGLMMKAAEDYLAYHKANGMRTLLVRISRRYLPGAPSSFFTKAMECQHSAHVFTVPGSRDTPCDFLHVDDIGVFLTRALGENIEGIAHLCYGKPITFGDAMEIVQSHLPGLRVVYNEELANTYALEGTLAREQLDWVPRHDWRQEIAELVAPPQDGGKKSAIFGWLKKLKMPSGKIMQLLELLLGGAAMQWFLSLSQVYATFRYVDIRLLFVILLGNVHGMGAGLVAAVLACASFVWGWIQDGNNPWMLLYNIDNWLPLILYLISGALFGHLTDRRQVRETFMADEKRQSDETTHFFQDMYEQAVTDRDQLQDQVMRHRDSYGRIYAIAQELDGLQPEQVFLSALSVLESTMKNHAVALYTVNAKSSFARLAVCSQATVDRLGKSFDLRNLPDLRAAIDKGELFANTKLRPDHPAYCAPILQNGAPIAIVVLWEADFEQQTLYYQNLFSVVSGLIQASLVRAALYFEAVSDDMYEAGTRIMTAKAFGETMGVHRKMRDQKVSHYLLVRVFSNGMTLAELNARIEKCTRTTDLIGQVADGGVMVLLPQATQENLPIVIERFEKAGLAFEVIDDVEQAYA